MTPTSHSITRRVAPYRVAARLVSSRLVAVSLVVISLVVVSLVAAPGMITPASADTLPSPQVSIATQLTQVQRGTFDGRDYLTLHIGGHEVGPSSCRSNVLRMDTGSKAGAARQAAIEKLALSAMLSASLVMVVVPLDSSQCVDGKPTFTDLYFLPSSP